VDLSGPIEALSKASSFEEKKEAGKKIYNLIYSFLPQVKRLSADKRESVPIPT